MYKHVTCLNMRLGVALFSVELMVWNMIYMLWLKYVLFFTWKFIIFLTYIT